MLVSDLRQAKRECDRYLYQSAAAPATVTRKGRLDPLIRKGWEGGRTVGETLNLQAGKPANAVTERANGVFRSRQEGRIRARPSALPQIG